MEVVEIVEEKTKGFDLTKYTGIDKTKVLRNCVEPTAGLAIFKAAFKTKQSTFEEWR